jgi:hypothetical protein
VAGPRWGRELCAAGRQGIGARVQLAAVGFRVRVLGVGDPICRAAGHPRRAGPARGLAGDIRDLGASGKKERRRKTGADRWGQAVREREGACWAGVGVRETRPSGKRKKERKREWACARKGPAQGGREV